MLPTDYGFTGQRFEATTGYIYDYGARYYDEYIGRFISADSIVPGAGNPQALNRYSYAFNSPLKYTDPSGHCPEDVCGFVAGFFIQWGHNLIAPISPGLGEALSVQPSESDARLNGRLAGNIASAAVAGIEAGMGATEVGAGAVACGTGVLCLGGAPAMALGAAEMLHAGATVAVASEEAAKLANILMAKGTGANASQRQFRSGELERHFNKHKAEFGYTSKNEYLQGAQNLTQGGKDILTFTRQNGDTLFYNPNTNEFAVLAKDGQTIRTYFKPVDGMQYWLDQTGVP